MIIVWAQFAINQCDRSSCGGTREVPASEVTHIGDALLHGRFGGLGKEAHGPREVERESAVDNRIIEIEETRRGDGLVKTKKIEKAEGSDGV